MSNALNAQQRRVLEHVVLDPDKWLSDCVRNFGERLAAEFLEKKIKRWEPEYLSMKDSAGYKNRAARQAEEEAAQKARSAKSSKKP